LNDVLGLREIPMSARSTVCRPNGSDRSEALALASYRIMNAALEKASRDWSSPIEALRHAIRAYSIYARRFRLILDHPDVGRENGELVMEIRRTVLTVARLVRAAQQAGRLRDGDPEEFAALFVGAAHGQADLELSGASPSDAELLPLLLLDLLARKSGGADAEDADARRADAHAFERSLGPARTLQ
jgi:Tetracyclin repressor-like, C-terminal domain